MKTEAKGNPEMVYSHKTHRSWNSSYDLSGVNTLRRPIICENEIGTESLQNKYVKFTIKLTPLSYPFYMYIDLNFFLLFSFFFSKLAESQQADAYLSRAANNSQSSDNGQPKFANVRQNCHLGRAKCLTNFLLQHLTISFTNKSGLSYMLLF